MSIGVCGGDWYDGDYELEQLENANCELSILQSRILKLERELCHTNEKLSESETMCSLLLKEKSGWAILNDDLKRELKSEKLIPKISDLFNYGKLNVRILPSDMKVDVIRCYDMPIPRVLAVDNAGIEPNDDMSYEDIHLHLYKDGDRKCRIGWSSSILVIQPEFDKWASND